ncbi:MAG: PaaI family thioesterase [Methanomassiliicoccaceae archaeon]|nr:PaaI family thioesterase [Methanomassiliicoccaceae archaeon]
MNDDEIRAIIDPQVRDELFDVVKEIHNAPYARLNGIETVSVSKDEIRTRMKLIDNKMNSVERAHGAAVFALADHTFALAANLGEYRQTALSVSIIYHRPGIGNELTAVSSMVSETNSVSTYDVKVYCDGRHIATATSIGFKLKDGRNNSPARH